MNFARPEQFKDERNDCTIKAFVNVTNLSYELIHQIFKKYGRKNHCGFCIEKYIQKICRELNIKAKQIKRSGSVAKLARQYPKGNIYCIKYNHAFTIIDGEYEIDEIHSHIKGAWLITSI